jgi:2-C-methyl-D-erythritol 4-phosphate cytidylyltransferase
MSHSPEYIIAIVPAAGIGSRMGSELPKQYLQLGNRSILSHTLGLLLAHPRIDRVVVALHPEDIWFASLPEASHPKLKSLIGGKERADSVLAALNFVKQQGMQADWALVHDAARPCLTSTDIDKLLASRVRFPQGAILAMQVRDTMKRANEDGTISCTVSRDNLWHALTPQLFPMEALARNLAAALAQDVGITDEASAMEWAGVSPGLIPGRADNIKVTLPDDLQLAELYLSRRPAK